MPFDENFQRLARMQNIFGPQNPIGGQGPNLSSNMPGSPLVMNAAGGPNPQPNPIEQYQPDTRASDMLFQMINQMPQRNKPGIGRKILASLGGLGGGPQMADQMLYQPYYQQMQDWQTKLGPVEKLAGEERMQNANMRQIAALILRDQQAQEKLDQQAKVEERRREQGQRALDIRDKVAATNEWKAQHPNHIVTTDSKGRLIGTDPQTNKAEFIIGPDGQPINSNDLTFEQKQNIAQIQNQGRLAIAGMQQAGQTARESEILTIPDPENPSKTILVRANPVTGQVSPITIDKQVIPTATKIGTPKAGTQQPANIAAIREIAQQTLDAIDNVVDEKGKLKSDVTGAVGKSYLAGYIPVTESYAARGKIKQLKDLMTLSLIGEIKRQSRTGATGFGNMQLRELGLLENAASRIDPKMKEEDFEKAVKEAKEKIMKILQDPTGDTGTAPLRKKQRNTVTGQTRVVESTDGGKTYNPVK